MEIKIRGNGTYELSFFGRAYVMTREQLDELHELIESVNIVEARVLNDQYAKDILTRTERWVIGSGAK